MKGSGISSAKVLPPPDRGAEERGRIVLDGRSVVLDPRRHAIRPDLADVRLADRVFAPHYAAPVARTVTRAVALRVGRDAGAAVVQTLAAGSAFELLDVLGDDAWGVAVGAEPLVGYVDLAALAEP